MERSSKFLIVRHAFADALSGEFQPSSDEQGNSHTLSRLARAAFLRGDERREFRFASYKYTPSWCGAIVAKTTCRVFGWSQDYTFERLGLEDGINRITFLNGPGLDSDFPCEEGAMMIVKGTGPTREETLLPLGLGKELNEARDAVTQTAHEFFEQAIKL